MLWSGSQHRAKSTVGAGPPPTTFLLELGAGFSFVALLGVQFDFFSIRHIIYDMRLKRVVLDTNVLVAAGRSRNGASFAILQAVRAGRFRMLASIPLFLEYEAVLKRPEQLTVGYRTLQMVDDFLDALSIWIEPVHLMFLWRPQLRDPDDEMVLETALNGRADVLITFNVDDFSAAGRFGLPVLTPAAFLRQLNEE